MQKTLPVLLYLFWSLVEVQSHTEYPYISFLGKNISNHSYVDLSQVGQDQFGSINNTVQCHTDLITCCHNNQPHHGDWFAPGSYTRLPFFNESGDMFQARDVQVVHLLSRNNPNGPSGIYRCVIATNTVYEDSDASVGETVYVGLYDRHGGGTCT